MTRPVPLTGLPVEGCVGAVRAALADRGGALLEAAPGAGKSTVLPLRLLDEPWLGDQRIVMLEPRRLAARAVARRLAELLGEPVGGIAGYRTRDERAVSDRTRIEVITEGLLTRRLQRDPSLPGVGLVIFDEVHERNLDGDLALAFTLDARAALRPDLRVLAMSATLDVDRLAALIGSDGPPVPVVRSEGRNHPVDIRWASLDARPAPRHGAANGRVATTVRLTVPAVRRALAEQEGDVLVFLPGAVEIRRTAQALAEPASLPPDTDVHQLYGALTAAEQDAALAPAPDGGRRVVLATDIAETSLTVPGVRVVVDAGQSRRPIYDARTGLTRLHTTACSQASAAQRAGRAGRTAPGVAYRLWSETDHRHRPAYTPPEIAGAELAAVVLQTAVWGAAVADLPFVDPPPTRAVRDATDLLQVLRALDDDGRPTAAGRAMAELPLHPRLARMVIEADDVDRSVAAAVAVLLGERDVLIGRPEERPIDLTERVQLVLRDGTGGERLAVDRFALTTARRRHRELVRRLGASAESGVPAEPAQVGRLLALAYPDRVAQARGSGRFRLRAGPGVTVSTTDRLHVEAFLVVAEVANPPAGDAQGADARVRLAAPLDRADLERVAATDITTVTEVVWDDERDDLRRRTVRRLGALELETVVERAAAGPATTAALLERVRTGGLGVLRWSDGARALQARVRFARSVDGDAWPDLDDQALLTDLDGWLAPLLIDATGRAGLERVDVSQALTLCLGHHRRPELDRLAPTSLALANGRSLTIAYTGNRPTAAVRVQQLFGCTTHPAVAGGRVPVVLELLSPAGRPVQITADLPAFWAGSWADVRKDMAGRYPKHPWPTDPATAEPPAKRPRR